MPPTGVSVLPNEPEFLAEWAERVAHDHTPRPREELAPRRADPRGDDPREAVRARSAVAFRERSTTARRASTVPRPVGVPRSEAGPAPVRAPRTQDRAATRAVALEHDQPPARRTVTIRGQVDDRYGATSRRRPDVPRHERPGFQPDRVAMWAVLLGVILVLVAATSAHAAVLLH
jgi:hypothetical protein